MPLHDCTKRVRAWLVVGEHRAWRPLGRDEQESADGFARVKLLRLLDCLCFVSTGHGRDVANLHRPAAWIGNVGIQLGEMRQNRIVELQHAFGSRKARGRRSERLAQRVEAMDSISAIWVPPAFCDHMAVTEQHEAVHLNIRSLLQCIEEPEHARGIHLVVASRAAR